MKSCAPRLAPSEATIEAMLDGEALILNVETGIYFGLSGVGARIWELLREGAVERVAVARALDG